MCHLTHVNKVACAILESRLPFVKEDWLIRLKDEHTGSPLGRRDTVTFLMDATFMQLLHGLQTKSEIPWLMQCPPAIAPLHLYLLCGLGTVKRYFVVGEESLGVGAAQALGEEFGEVVAAFRKLARRELQALCLACEHSTLPSCELRKASL
jgi:hypothetical protein